MLYDQTICNFSKKQRESEISKFQSTTIFHSLSITVYNEDFCNFIAKDLEAI